MSTLHSTVDAARILGCDRTTVYRVATANDIGQRTKGSKVLLTEADIEALRKLIRDAPGCPKFVPGNYFGQAPKKSRKK